MKKKILVACLCVALAVLTIAGTTLAYLTATTGPVVNTFTVGNIDITLTETTTDYKMVPGSTITKDPKVTVEAGSEACWLFVKVEESTNLDSFITYTIDSGWTALTGVDGVYYRDVPAVTADNVFAVLTSNQVTVKATVTKGMMDGLTAATYPTLTFTAYAVQKEGIATAEAAWEQANPTT